MSTPDDDARTAPADGSDDGPDADRTVVKTYVPRYQKDRWRDEADELGMSQSEFVRAMVQAGRRGFDPGPEPDEGGSDPSDPGGDALETRVQEVLKDGGYLSWDELVAALSNDFEDRLEDALGSLQARNLVQHSGRHGGYGLTEAER